MSLTEQMAFFIAASVSVVPTALLIYFSLKRIYRLLDDRKLYFMLGLSLMAGVGVAVFQTVAGESVKGSDLFALLLVALLFSLFDNLLKIVILNLKRYRAQYDTTFYGICFALLGSMVATFHGFRIFRYADRIRFANNTTLPGTVPSGGLERSYFIAGFIILTFASVSYHGALGVYNGYFSSKGRFWSFSHISRSTLIALPFNILFFWWYYWGFMDLVALSLALIYSIIVLFWILRKYFPRSLPPEDKGILAGTFPWRSGPGSKREGEKGRKGLLERLREIEERE